MSKQNQEQGHTDYLNMSDEELMNAPPPDFSQETVVEQEEEEPEQEEETVLDPGSDVEEEELEEQKEKQEPESDQVEEEQEEDKKSPETEGVEPGSLEPGSSAPVEGKENEPKAVNYEEEYKKFLAPFKANGKEFQVSGVEEAQSLMKMGVNYIKKMTALKPNLKMMKMLENNNLLDEEKLSYLIELDRKSPEAIHKLIKDSGLDPMDYDAEKAGEYQPKSHSVSDRVIDLDTVLDEIEHTSAYNRTLGIVSKEWDGASKQAIVDEPGIIKIINDHVERGVYDIVAKEVERERTFGRLTGLSDLQAYKQVGDVIQARGGFDHLGSSQGNKAPGTRVTPPQSRIPDDKLKDKKRAASSSRSASSSKVNTEFNPLSMSDEEFLKIADSRYK